MQQKYEISDVTRLWQKQAMPAPETALPALENFGK